MQAHGVTDTVLQEFNAQVASFMPILNNVEGQNGGELFIRKWIAFANAALWTNQYFGVCWDGDTCCACNYLWGATYKLRIHGMTVFKEEFANLVGFFFAHKVSALCL